MSPKCRFLGFDLTMALAGLLLSPPHAAAQDTKRKVKSRVTPGYPALAKQMNVSGKVKIEVIISPDGHVKSTKVLGGSPLLVQSALTALKDWKFEPAPKETTEIVEFEFKGGPS
jgi:TonB family protein